MEGMLLEKITPDMADAVHALLYACGRDLSLRFGFRNWDPPAPIYIIQQDALEREVYLFRKGSEVIATITLGMQAAIPYDKGISWSADISSAVYVNRLAVHPLQQGYGYGHFCMRFAEDRARALGATAVRCDVLAVHEKLRLFYEGMEYKVAGERDHSGWHFACYEKEL
jgi:GNAT superfamily N-acetyltransferase